MTLARAAAAEPFFLVVDGGQRFCLFHPAAGACRGAVLYVHPFAEEMNRSRRMAALQARALAALGYGVLQIDLHGCGDSSGDFGDARWEGWKRDLAAASAWLDARLGQPLTLLGLRLGGALALDFVRGAAKAPAAIVLWQPALSGQAFMTQFLRLRVANDMLSGGGDAKAGTASLRAALARGETLEIAGYDLHPELAQAIDTLDPALLAPRAIPVHWFELATSADRPLPAGASSTIERWRRARVPVQARQVVGQPFWSTQEITECPALVAATCDAIREPDHAV
ncbi:hydrolase 2, exosortase A system-associated [Telluria aromaticivorans]|uniref:Hydrolase 2, exosortase A system-associated n=1 Tax=Telluria aromaticivorans TaxID=2725995 RepID=A0A7Y2K190_9BURK|nr:hydrolase 2, exosortase A system-associated [Telluria aromaticivorans]NNG24220.1 hydrolase 2, exosortase A system-associated [Telluria aromaticivorans]